MGVKKGATWIRGLSTFCCEARRTECTRPPQSVPVLPLARTAKLSSDGQGMGQALLVGHRFGCWTHCLLLQLTTCRIGAELPRMKQMDGKSRLCPSSLPVPSPQPVFPSSLRLSHHPGLTQVLAAFLAWATVAAFLFQPC